MDRTVDILAVHALAAGLAQGGLQRRASQFEFQHLDRRHQADATHAIRHDLDQLLRRAVAEHRLVLRVGLAAQRVQAVVAPVVASPRAW